MTMTAAAFNRDAMLEEYRVRRWQDELVREDRDIGYAAERAMHKADGVPQPVTFREFIQQHQPPTPDPADVMRYTMAAAWEARMMQETAREAVLAADALMACEVTALRKAGMTCQAIADTFGWSKQMVSKYVAADRRNRRNERSKP